MASWNDITNTQTNQTLANYYRMKAAKQGQPYNVLNTASQEKSAPKNGGGGWGGFWKGLGYYTTKLGGGMIRGLEGITDFVVGGVADLIGQDEFAEKLMKNDWLEYDAWDEIFNPSKGHRFAGDVTSGVGGMLPAIGVSIATGGAGLASTATFATQAAGQSTSEAVKKTGSLGGKEWLYGTASGAMETAIEMASGGIGGSKAGKVLGKQLGKSTAGKLGIAFASEGLEEVASDVLDPLLQRGTRVDKNAKMPTAKELGRTFAVGGATGAVMGGAGRLVGAAKVGGFKNLKAYESGQELTERLSDNNVRQAKGKKGIYTEQDVSESLYKTSNALKEMDAPKRREYLAKNGRLGAIFNEDGSIKDSPKVKSDVLNSYDNEAYSASLKGREGSFAYAPVARNAQNAESTKNIMRNMELITNGKTDIVLTDESFGKTADGKDINAEYRDGIIYLNAKATDFDKASIVAFHEVVHTLEGTDAYGKLKKFIENQIKNDASLASKYGLEQYLKRYAGAQNTQYSVETKVYEAETEIVADFLANEVFAKPEVANRLINNDRNIAIRMLEWVRSAIKRLGMDKQERGEYAALRKMERYLSAALDAGTGGVKLSDIEKEVQKRKAEEQKANATQQKTPQASGKLAEARYSFSSISTKFFGKKDDGSDLTVEEFESKDYKETEGYKNYVAECLSNMEQTRENFDEKTAQKEVEKAIDGIVSVAVAMKKAGYDIIDENAERSAQDSKGRKLFSSLEPNSDYFTSSDISTICDKRINFTEISEEIVRREEEMNVPDGKRFFNNVDNYFYLHEVMAKKGLTTACRQCYVESMRKNLSPMARAFITLVTEPNENNKKNAQLFDKSGKAKETNTRLRKNVLEAIAENEYPITASDLTYKMLTTADGLAQLKLQAPLVYEAFNSFYGQAKPKMPRTATPFRFGELTALLTDNKGKINEGLVDRINRTGGFRLQSYSDFQIKNYVDVLQVIFEAGTLGLNGHAYTKVPAFLDATQNTNLKRNISVFMYEDNGKWVIDKGDSFPATLEQLSAIVNADTSGNTGVIAVVQNDDMAAYVMVNDDIAFFIPYHKSGMKMDVVRSTVVTEGKGKNAREILGYKNIKDHTKMQSETWKETTSEHKQFTKVKKPINIYEFWDFDNKDNLSKKELIEKNIKAYINACEREGYYPKFRNYVMNNEAVLKDMVKYAKELGIDADLDALTFKYKGYTIPYGYYKCLGDFNMFKPNGKAAPHDVLSLKNYDFKKAVSYFDDAAKLRRTEILQQIVNGEERKALAESDLTADQIEDIVKQKRKEVTEEALATRGYKAAERRLSIQIGDENVSTKGEYQFDTDSETMLREIAEQNAIENFLPEGLSSDFVKAIRRNGFAPKRLYRGMDASELDFIIENGYIKSNSSYNFSDQQGQTRFTPRVETALSYATSFAPKGIRERFFEDGNPAYIVEVGNYTDLNFINEDTIESYTNNEVDTKYITRVIELSYDEKTHKVNARDIKIKGMNNAKGETLHGVPMLMQDKVTGTILYAHQGVDGFEDGKYISEKNPDILFDYEMVESHKGMKDFDYNAWLGISGKESNLVPYSEKSSEKRFSIDMDAELEKLLEDMTFDELQELIGEDSQFEIEAIESLPTKQERREAYIARLYQQGNLNEVITKIVKKHPKMQAYFKNTQMNQKYNPLYRTKDDELIVMFHGTPDKNFNIFNTKKIGKHGTVMGSGLYFTESLRYAEDYKTEDGRVIATLLNIEKPLSRSKITMSKEELKKFIREIVDANGEDYLSNYGDVYLLGYEKLLDKTVNKLFDYHTNDADLIEDIYVTSRMEFDEFHDGLTNLLGYDGIIAWNKAEGTQAVVFKSNQAKDVFNFNPTKNADIRYSIDDSLEAKYPNLNLDQEIKDIYKAPAVKLNDGSIVPFSIVKDRPKYARYKPAIPTTTAEQSAFATNNKIQAKDMESVGWVVNGEYYVTREIRVAKLQRVTEPKVKISTKEKLQAVRARVKKGWLAVKMVTTNDAAGIEDAGKHLGVDLRPKVQKARSSKAAAVNMISNAQTDKNGKVVGESLYDIFKPIQSNKKRTKAENDAYTADFYEYLAHYLNEDRMSLEAKAQQEMQQLAKNHKSLRDLLNQGLDEFDLRHELQKTEEGRKYLQLMDVQNKPVFTRGDSIVQVTAEESRQRINELEKAHPEFKEHAEKVWKYNQNLLQRRVDAGLLTQEQADNLNAMYPHYIPTHRDMEGAPGTGTAGTKRTPYSIEVKKTIKMAKGSELDILDISLMMSKQTQQVLQAEAQNELANALYDAAVENGDFRDVAVTNVEDLKDLDVNYEADKPLNREIVFYKDGQRITMEVSQAVFEGFQALNPKTQTIAVNNPITLALRKMIQVFKSAVTSWNPLFTLTNAIRDMQEALFYSKHNKFKFFAAYWKNFFSFVKSNNELWQQYLAMGGATSGFFNSETGVYDRRGRVKKSWNKLTGAIAKVNWYIEQIPRFTEFALSVKAGKSLEQALLDSADVTTNFSRGGTLTKQLNAYLIPFLNPSVQGWSKLWRTFVEPISGMSEVGVKNLMKTAEGRKTLKAFGALIFKCVVFGIAVGLLNDMLYDDDEDYEHISQNVKDNYFLFKTGNKFIRIPKGRVTALFGSVADRVKKVSEGEDVSFKEWFDSASQMVSPVDSASRTIFSPFTDVRTNTTWYGSAIENRNLQSFAPSQRYDESTSSIAKFLGNMFNYSPKKIHYLIDQYTGVVGDIILPMTTEKAERDMFSNRFVLDPVLQNDISSEFYSLLDSAMYAKNAGDYTGAMRYRYLTQVSNSVSDMYKQKREIESSNLSDSEKQKQTRIIQALINETLLSATEGVDDFEQFLIDSGYEDAAVKLLNDNAFKKFDEKQQTSAAQKLTDYYYAMAVANMNGGEREAKYYFYEAIGGAETAIYLTEIASIASDKDKQGNTIANSRKEKVHAYIEKLRLSATKKYMLMYLAGYTPSDNGKKQIEQYLLSKGCQKEAVGSIWN